MEQRGQRRKTLVIGADGTVGSSLSTQGSFDRLPQENLLQNLKLGVPNESRPSMWTNIAKVKEMKAQYQKLLYERLCKMNSKYDRYIEIDVARTHSHIPFFTKPEYQAQERLTRILKAYAAYDPELGYTQGMNEMVGILLMVMANYNQYQDTVRLPHDCEKNTFWILVYIMKEKGYRDSFKDACPKLMENLYNFETILEEEYPDVLEHMEANEVTVHTAFTHMFLSLACQGTPVEFSIKIIDVFLLNGERILTDVLLKVIEVCKQDILSLQDDKLMNFFKREMMNTCFVKYNKELNKIMEELTTGAKNDSDDIKLKTRLEAEKVLKDPSILNSGEKYERKTIRSFVAEKFSKMLYSAVRRDIGSEDDSSATPFYINYL